MPRNKRPDTSVRFSPENIDLLRILCKRYDLVQNDLLGTLLDMCEQHDLLNKGWQEKLTAALERGQREIEALKYYEDPSRCPAIAMGSEKYKCVWGREEKPPYIRILEKEYQASLELCKRCKITLQMRQETAGLRSKVTQLENKLTHRANVSYKVPICHKGATLNEDSTEFSLCPKHTGENVSVENYCKKISSGLPCALYAERVITVSDGESKLGSKFNVGNDK